MMFGAFHWGILENDSERCNPFLAIEVLLSGISYPVDGIVSAIICDSI